MENKNLNKLDNPITSEQARKCDLDIETIKTLDEYAKSTGNLLILSGGYATEAHCGGNITRPHDDIDAHFVLTKKNKIADVFSFVEDVNEKEETNWKVRKKSDDKVEYLEDNENLSFFNKRRLEFTIHEGPLEKHNFEKKVLIDSTGKIVSVNVVGFHEVIARKIHKLSSIKGGLNTKIDRHTDDRDSSDLKRLINQADYEVYEVIKALRKKCLEDNLDKSLAKVVAQRQYDYAISLL